MRTLIHGFGRNLTTLLLSAIAGLLATASLASAAPTVTFTGGGAPNNNWNDAANWSTTPALPANGDNLVFLDGNAPTVSTTNNLLSSVDTITFSASTSLNFTLTGSALTLGTGAPGSTVLTNNSTVTQTVSFAGTPGITLAAGAGTGGEFFNAANGNLDITSNVALNSDALNIESTGTGTGVVTISGVISGTVAGGAAHAAVVVESSGNLVLTTNNTYTSTGTFGTALLGGTLNVGASGALGADRLGINGSSSVLTNAAAGGSLQINNAITVASNFTVAPVGTFTLGGAVTLVTGDDSTVIITNTTPSGTGNIVFSGPIGDGGDNIGLTLNGGGVGGEFTFEGTNTYTGLTTVTNDATLNLNETPGANAYSIDGDLFIDSTSTVNLLQDQQINPNSTVTVNGTLDLLVPNNPTPGEGVQTISVLDGANTGSIDFGSSFNLTVTDGGTYLGTMTGGSSGTNILTVTGGTLVLGGGEGISSGNNYAGTTTLTDGAEIQAATGSGASSTAYTDGFGRVGNAFSPNSDYVLDPSTLDLNGNNEEVGSLSGTAGSFVLNSATGTTAILTVGGDNASTTFSGVIEGTLSGTQGDIALVLDMNNQGGVPGSLTLDNTNTYTGVISPGDTGGDTMIKSGYLVVGTNNALPVTTTVWLNSDEGTTNTGSANDGGEEAVLVIGTTDTIATTQTIANLNFVAPNGNGNSIVTIGADSTLTVTGAITLTNDTTSPGAGETEAYITGGTLDLNGTTTTITVAGQNTGLAIQSPDLKILSIITDGGISYTGTPSTYNGTPATLDLDAVNTYAGGTTINEGALITGGVSTTVIGGVTYSQALGTGFVNNAGGTGPSFLWTAPFFDILYGYSPPASPQNVLVGTTGTPEPYTQGINGSLGLAATSSAGAPTLANDFGAGVAGVNYDTVTVTGAATNLAGNLTLDFNYGAGASPSQGQRYVVLNSLAAPVGTSAIFTTANTILPGQTTINGVTTNLPSPFYWVTTYNDTFPGIDPVPAGDTNPVVVTLLLPFASFAGLTPNQTSVAQNVDKNLVILNNNGSLAFPTGVNADFFNNIITGLNLSTYNGTLGQSLDQLSPQRLEVLHNIAFDNYALDVSSLNDEFARERDGQAGIFDTSGFAFNDSTIGSQLSQVKSRLLAWNPPPENGLLSDSPQAVLGSTDTGGFREITPNSPQGSGGFKQISPQEAGTEKKVNGFIDGGADLGSIDSNADVNNSSYTTARVRGGVDYRVTTDIRVGALFEYSHTDADLDNEGSKAHVDSYMPGLFATYADRDGYYANALFTGGVNDYSVDRDVIIPGVNRTASGSPSGTQWGGNLNGGYEFHQNNWIFGPSVGVTYVNLGVNSYTESGAGAADLDINSQSAQSLRSLLGGTARYQVKIGSVTLSPHLSASWQHEYLNQATGITSQFVGLPGGAFTVTTTKGDRNDALLSFGIDVDVVEDVTLFLDYQAEAGGESYFGQSGSGGVKVSF